MLLCLSSAPAAVDTILALSPRCGVGNVKVPLTRENVACDGHIRARSRSTLQVSKHSAFYPGLVVDGDGVGTVAHAGAVLLLGSCRTAGLDRELSAALSPWRRPGACTTRARSCWIWR